MLTEIWLSICVLLFGAIFAVVVAVVTLQKSKEGWGIYSSRILLIGLVIVGGFFLITAGYSQHQTAPMFTLLGMIAGYLLKG